MPSVDVSGQGGAGVSAEPVSAGAGAPMTDLRQRTAAAFSTSGPLAALEVHYAAREAQQQLAAAVAQALEQREPLAAEAGTGVGKTFAYLVPLLLSGKRALISTATKSLQDQLYLRDLPRLRDALKVPATTALLKGRASYLCRHRLLEARRSASLPDRFAVRMLAKVEAWAQSTTSGDLAEVVGLDERSPVVPLVSSTRDNCLGSECPEFHACHLMKARRAALAADVVVVNHHLFFADLMLRDTGVAELLPSVDAVVFDEAHQLIETGIQFLGVTLGTAAVLDLARDLLACGLQHARGLQPWDVHAHALEKAARTLRLDAAGPLREVRGVIKLRWDERRDALSSALSDLQAACSAARHSVSVVSAAAAEFARLSERLAACEERARGFAEPAASGRVRWIDLSPQQVRLVDSPLDVRETFAPDRRAAGKAWIFTSATLGDDTRLSWFTSATGLDDAVTLRLGSPFDYPKHARVWVPQAFPRPNEAAHPAAVGRLAGRCAAALGGRTFVLTTTLRALPQVADALSAQAQQLGRTLDVLVQGSQPRRALLQRYGDGHGRVLVGSHSFWEGIDMAGEALQCVVIDKLPFPPPNDPLVEARVRQLRAQGRDAFSDYFVAEAAVSLKQGAGRLIRSEHDKGLLVVCDPRLVQERYGRRLMAALPPMGPLADETAALQWLAELASEPGPGAQAWD